MDPFEWLQFFPPFIKGLITATGIGLVIGLEREHSMQTEKPHLAGFRTFPLICIFGYLAGVLAQDYAMSMLPAATAGLLLLVAVAYYVQTQNGKLGLTTEFAIILVFFLGIMVANGKTNDALAVVVTATLLLSLKDEFHSFVARITEQELLAFVKFFVIALLIMPNLPDKTFGPEGILNYRDVGWIIVIISSLSFVGYLLLKFGGMQQGILITALLGGLFSSTMVAWIFGARSRESPGLVKTYAAGILLSSTIMYVRVVALAALFNPGLAFQLAIPCGIMLLLSLFAVWRIMRMDGVHNKEGGDIPLGNPLDLKNALFFGILYIAIGYFLYYSQLWMGTSGAYLTGLVSGVADIDAITINSAQLATRDASQLTEATKIVLVAMLSNTVFKISISTLRGHPQIRPFLLVTFGAVLVVGLLWFLFL